MAAVQSALKVNGRFAAEQRRCIPINNRSDVVLVERTLQALTIYIERLLLPPEQILSCPVLKL
ncbi:MAG: hypothetical protein JOZ45_19325 [Acidobacteriaceae bacterium]|nr:hypothetical protein [Acidobacteriaceae bacterium]